MSTNVRYVIAELKGLSRPSRHPSLERAKWGVARAGFIALSGFCLTTVVGGLVLAPVVTWCMFDDWRFWRHLRRGLRLYRHGYRIMGLMIRGEGRFMLSVPLFSPPYDVPVPGSVELRADWEHGRSCGSCVRCCQLGSSASCPVLDTEHNRCNGYLSFYWRYFNCGRFPSHQHQIDYYGCPKWKMSPTSTSVGSFPVAVRPGGLDRS
ncbi:MAG: hypothetical protein KDI63_12950 [Gammaproteobacteria bacterium]|nr:hypothetical protein [Gammaproteobacteria bacterium]